MLISNDLFTPTGEVGVYESNNMNKYSYTAAKEAYKSPNRRKSSIGYFTYANGLSDKNRAVYINPYTSRAIYSVRGTNPTNWSDLGADWHILSGTESSSNRFNHTLKHFDKVRSNLAGYDMYTTGHSLGASQASYINRRRPGAVKRVYGFSSGSGLRDLSRRNRSNETHYTNYYDPITWGRQWGPQRTERYMRKKPWKIHAPKFIY